MSSTPPLLVDFIIDTIGEIQHTRKLLWKIQDEIKVTPLGEVSSQWSVYEAMTPLDEHLRRSFYDLGKAVADATKHWNRDELLAVFGLLEE